MTKWLAHRTCNICVACQVCVQALSSPLVSFSKKNFLFGSVLVCDRNRFQPEYCLHYNQT